tara:strand:- start:2032 stop:3747 length:1716 start_codon:yes stop_codon:yes gene_type:complete
MSHHDALLSLRPFHAVRERLAEGYGKADLGRDLLAGLTVGVIAIPLSMALAIASGVPPQYGLYTAIVAGAVIALTGGSRFSVSGPTAAFVVVLYPIAQSHGLSGLLMATMMAGALLILLAVLRLGRLIEYIPPPVTLGFTGGIAVVIATLQIKDLFGLPLAGLPESYIGKLQAIVGALPSIHWPSVAVASLTFLLLVIWPRLRTPVPPHLPALMAGTLLAWWLNHQGLLVDTIGSRFSYRLDGGAIGQGVPAGAPIFAWPWLRAGDIGLQWHWSMLRELLPAAFAIAMLGAIESLLCAVVLDGMSGKRHSANSELLGQGIGNLVAPLFGAIPATAALARSAANFRAGARSPIAALVHALVVLFGMVVLARWLGLLPMPALAALLLLVAWNMSEADKTLKLVKTAPWGDVLVLITCLSLTVFLDMVVAITAGVLLAAILFVREVAGMTRVTDVSAQERLLAGPLPEGWSVFKITGPLFFAAADRVFAEISNLSAGKKGVVLYMDGVTVLDAGGLATLLRLGEHFIASGTRLMIADLSYQPLKTLARASVQPVPGAISYHGTLAEALRVLREG